MGVGCSLVAQRLKRLPAMQETRVRSLGQKDSLEKKMATHSSILAWRIPWMEESGGLQSTGSQRVGNNWMTSLSVDVKVYLIVGVTCISLIINDVKHLRVSLEKETYLNPLFLNWVIFYCPFTVQFYEFFIYSLQIPYQVYDLQIFSPILWLCSHFHRVLWS